MSLIREMTPEVCSESYIDKKKQKNLNFNQAKFIVLKSYIGKSGTARLGYLWLILEPVVGSLVFLAVLSVLRGAAEIKIVNVLIGYSVLACFNLGFKSGLGNTFDDGGLKIERINSETILMAKYLKLIIDVLFISSGASVAITLLGVSPIGVLSLYLANILVVISANSVLSLLQPLVSKFPDLNPLILNQLPLIIFFGSPILYPLDYTSGLHYTISTYNPLVYFIEPVRYIANDNDDIFLLHREFAVFLLISFALTIQNYTRKFDYRRWKES